MGLNDMRHVALKEWSPTARGLVCALVLLILTILATTSPEVPL